MNLIGTRRHAKGKSIFFHITLTSSRITASDVPPQRDVDHGRHGQDGEQRPPFSDAVCDPGQGHVPDAIEEEGPQGREEHSHSLTQDLRSCRDKTVTVQRRVSRDQQKVRPRVRGDSWP